MAGILSGTCVQMQNRAAPVTDHLTCGNVHDAVSASFSLIRPPLRRTAFE